MRIATVLLVGALVGCGTQEVAGPAPSPAATSTAPSPSPSPSPVGRAAEQVVGDLLAALGGDTPRAWELLTQEAQDSFGDYAAFEDLQTEYAEGLAAFADLPRSALELGAGAEVVTVAGEVTREGDTERDAVALGVRQGRVDLLSPVRPAGVAVEVPQPGAAVPSGSELRAVVPAQSTPTVVVDDQVQPSTSEPSDGDRLLVRSSPELPAGEHVLTVAAVRADGVVDADAVVFSVS